MLDYSGYTGTKHEHSTSRQRFSPVCQPNVCYRNNRGTIDRRSYGSIVIARQMSFENQNAFTFTRNAFVRRVNRTAPPVCATVIVRIDSAAISSQNSLYTRRYAVIVHENDRSLEGLNFQ